MKTMSKPSRSTAVTTPGRYTSNDERWNAVVRRDPQADGNFFYSVRTTGVYCRPSCAARLARRENVQFHNTCAEAEHAGFRACLRCQPAGAALSERHAAMVAAACHTIATAEEPPDLTTLAKAAGMSRFHFQRVFTRVVGLTPKAYASAQRVERLRRTLPKSGTVTEALYAAGYQSNSRFYAESNEMLGMAPRKFRKGGPGEILRFAVDQCSLGLVLVAKSEQGVCAILLGDDADELTRELHRRFPQAQLQAGDDAFQQTIAEVIRFVEAPQRGWKLPLDVRGTAFQRRVWQALQAIPAGATASYTQVAERMGSPKAVRALAGACAANPIAVAIPCHRVLRADGSLSGYRWGVERKRALLSREAKAAK